MNQPPAFQLYSDDFLGGVCDMTQQEIGAYILLLCYQWNNGAIPLDITRAALIAKGEVTKHVLSKFPNGVNQRLEEVRNEKIAYLQRQSEAGKLGMLKRWGNRRNNEPNNEPITEQLPKHNSPVSYLLSPKEDKTPIAPNGGERSKATELQKQAEEIYEAYPRKIAKGAALKAIRRALTKHPADFLLSAAKRYAVARDGEDPNYTPYPATWFNREQFMDDPANWSRMKMETPGHLPEEQFENF